jgi:hypothetical protein
MIALPGRLLRKDDKRLCLDISRKISDLNLLKPQYFLLNNKNNL